MGRKHLQDVANTLPQMLVGWRMYEDLDTLADLPNGTLTIDLLSRSASHDVAGCLQLHIVSELAAWLAHRLDGEGVTLGEVSRVTLEADIRSDRVDTDRARIVLFDFECRCSIVTDNRRYSGVLRESHKWHRRIDASAPDVGSWRLARRPGRHAFAHRSTPRSRRGSQMVTERWRDSAACSARTARPGNDRACRRTLVAVDTVAGDRCAGYGSRGRAAADPCSPRRCICT